MRRAAIPALTLLSLAWLALGIAHHWGHWLDDAYISFRYALNFAEGRGMVFNPGERVEGITNLGFALMIAPFARSNPLFAARVMGITSTVASLLLLVAWGRRSQLGAPAMAAALAVLVLPPWVPFAAVQGLETPVVMALVTLGWSRYAAEREGRGAPWAGAAMGLAPAMRPDAAILAALIGLWHTLRGGPWNRRVGAAVLAVLLGAAGLVGLKLHWFGAILPNTFYAKTGAFPFYGGQQYLLTFLQAPSPAFGALTLLTLALALGRALRRDDRALPGLVMLSWLGMAWVVNGDFFANFRLLVPAWPALAGAVGLLVAALPGRFGPSLGALAVLASLAPMLRVSELSRPVDRERFPRTSARITMLDAPLFAPWQAKDWDRVLGDAWTYPTAWILTNTSPNERVGMTDIGLVSYTNDNPILDLLGLTDPMFSGKIPADEASRWAYVRDNANHLLLDINKAFFRTWSGRMVEEGWELEAACGPLWFLRNPKLVSENHVPDLDAVVERALRTLERDPDMVGLHETLTLHLRERGLDDARTLAFIAAAEDAAPGRAALHYEILRHELDLAPGGTRLPSRCTPSELLRPLDEVAEDGGWPHVVGQSSSRSDPTRGCEDLQAASALAWTKLSKSLEGDISGECALVAELSLTDPTAALAQARASARAVERELQILDRARLHDALRSTEQAWQACRTDRPKNTPRRLREQPPPR